MIRAVLSIGSNLGDRLAHLQSARDSLGSAVLAISPVYETAPWGGVPQDNFLNAIVIAVGDDTYDWLAMARALEASAGRVRQEHWGPRTLDVDVVSLRVGSSEIISEDPALTLPHPRAHERAFVLVPWLAVEPTAALTVGGVTRPVVELVQSLDADDVAGVRRVDVTLSGPVT